MRTILAGLTFLMAVSASAASINITSFRFIGQMRPLAELCGQVVGATAAPSFVRLHVDPRLKNSAVYNAVADADGLFCMSLVSYSGLVEASAIGSASVTTATVK